MFKPRWYELIYLVPLYYLMIPINKWHKRRRRRETTNQDINVSTDYLRIGDRVKGISILNDYKYQLITKIDKDEIHKVYYVYTYNSGFYYTFPFGEQVTILRRRNVQ